MKPENAAEIMKEYRRKRVAHRTALDTRDALLEALLSGEGKRIIALVGPSSVGKTTVLSSVQEKLIEFYRAEMESDPGFLPLIALNTVTGLDGNYNWRDAFARLLETADEPLIRKKIKDKKLLLQLDGAEIMTTRGLVGTELRRSFESLVKNRRIRYIFLDEGSAIVDAAANRTPVVQFNILKSLCVNLDVVIVMAGAYDLLGFRDGNGQLIRRTNIIHMERYFLDKSALANTEKEPTERDYDEAGNQLYGIYHFSSALDSLVNCAPITLEENLFDDMPYYFMKSVGCVGNFRDWLDRACIQSLIHNNGFLTQEIMEYCSLSNRQLQTLLTDALFGEQQMIDVSDADIAALYGLPSLRTIQCNDGPENPEKKRKSRVGQRGPSRDISGGLNA